MRTLKTQFRLIAAGEAHSAAVGIYTSPDLYDDIHDALAIMLRLNADAHREGVVFGIEAVTTMVHDWTSAPSLVPA